MLTFTRGYFLAKMTRESSPVGNWENHLMDFSDWFASCADAIHLGLFSPDLNSHMDRINNENRGIEGKFLDFNHTKITKGGYCSHECGMSTLGFGFQNDMG